ncbi:MAG: class I SAM-dependent methyltransferase [Polyangiaceae bacterium]
MDENADQIAYWNGPTGDRWAGEQVAIDLAFAAFTTKLFECARLRRNGRVLDVGCGCGTTTLTAAEAVGPGGAVVGVDVSAPMLARARQRSVGRPSISYVLADAAEHGFHRTFDAIISRFGIMFFRRPAVAFARLRNALRSDGTLAFVCWRAERENDWVSVPAAVAASFVSPEPEASKDDPGPFAFADAPKVKAILDEAGFHDVAIMPFDADVVLSEKGLDEAVRFAMTTGPTARRLKDVDDVTKAEVGAALATRLRPLVSGTRVALRGGVWLVTGATTASGRG